MSGLKNKNKEQKQTKHELLLRAKRLLRPDGHGGRRAGVPVSPGPGGDGGVTLHPTHGGVMFELGATAI